MIINFCKVINTKTHKIKDFNNSFSQKLNISKQKSKYSNIKVSHFEWKS